MEIIEKFKLVTLKVLEISSFQEYEKKPFIEKMLQIAFGNVFLSLTENVPTEKMTHLKKIFGESNDPREILESFEETFGKEQCLQTLYQELKKTFIGLVEKIMIKASNEKKIQLQQVLEEFTSSISAN